MGLIEVTVVGSFTYSGARSFKAQTHGHAHAVAEAIKFLSEEVLPSAINLDHELAVKGSTPDEGFQKPEE